MGEINQESAAPRRWRRLIRIGQLTAIGVTLTAVAWTSAQAIASGPLDDVGRHLRTVPHKRAPPQPRSKEAVPNSPNQPAETVSKTRARNRNNRSQLASLAPVNINTAVATELVRLPGIGPAKAKRIIEFRERRGSFKRVRDLRRVKGIGRKTLRRLAPYLTVKEQTTM